MPAPDPQKLLPVLGLAASVAAHGAASSVAANTPECRATVQADVTEPRSTTFSAVIDDDTETVGVLALSCAGGLGAFDYDLGLRATSEDDADLRVRDFKFGTDVGQDGFLIAGYHPVNTDPSFTIQPLGLFGDSADYSTFMDRTFERESAPMLRFEQYFGDTLVTATYSENRRHDLNSEQIVTSAAFSFGNTDAQVLYRYDEELSGGVGAAFSTVIGDGLQLHGSAFVQRGSARLYHQDAISGTFQFRREDDSPIGRHRLDDDDLVTRAVIGGHYTFANGHNFLAEFIYDGEGMSDAEWDRYIDIVEFHRTAAAPSRAARDGNIGFDAEVLQNANMRNYAFLRYSLTPDTANLALSALINLSEALLMAWMLPPDGITMCQGDVC